MTILALDWNAMGRIISVDKRLCTICGSDTTYRYWKRDVYYWHRISNGWACDRCYCRTIKKRSRVTSPKQFRFGSWRGHFIGPKRMLTGYCSRCSNNIYDGSCKQTSMHHWYYLRISPMCCREEVCQSCHVRLASSSFWHGSWTWKNRLAK